MTPFRSEALENGVSVAFFDLSNRYFGDYHRVRVEVRISVLVPGQEQPLVKVRMLDRMGVPGAEVPAVRARLADDFWINAAAYLGRADYPARLLAAEVSPRRLTPASLLHAL